MVGSIIPIVYGERQRFGISPSGVLYAGSSVAGGAVVGGAVAGLGSILPGIRSFHSVLLVVAVAAFGLWGLRDLRILEFPAPEWRRQVPNRWRSSFPAPVVATLYGASLGAGVLTFVPFSSFYSVLGWLLAAGDGALGLTAGAAAGLGRVLPLLAIGRSSRGSGERVLAISDTLVPWRGLVEAVNGIAGFFFLGFLGASVLLAR